MRTALRLDQLYPSPGDVLLLALLLCAIGPAVGQEPSNTAAPARFSVRWNRESADTNKIRVEITGLSPATIQELQQTPWKLSQWQQTLAVYADQGDLIADMGLPPMAGSYGVASNLLWFVPRFQLDPGVNYRAIFYPARLPREPSPGDNPITALFKLPPRQSDPTTIVTHVYPSAQVLPEN